MNPAALNPQPQDKLPQPDQQQRGRADEQQNGGPSFRATEEKNRRYQQNRRPEKASGVDENRKIKIDQRGHRPNETKLSHR